MQESPAELAPPRWRRMARLAAAIGPGLMVMLADTDAGSIVTAAQSGAQWGYRMVVPQFLLIPVLYVIQEITVRLAAYTGKGHAALIRDTLGEGAVRFAVAALILGALGAIATEFSGVAGVATLFGVPPHLAVVGTAVLLIAVGTGGSQRSAELVGIALGLFELAFVPAAALAHPQLPHVLREARSLPLGDARFLVLLSANVGAVVMPWMIFYQQGAVARKGLAWRNIRDARADTLIGAVATQVVMVCAIVAVAATIGRQEGWHPLQGIPEISLALEPFLGYAGARLAFGLGILGASLVAALVVSTATAYGVLEALGRSLGPKAPPGDLRLLRLSCTGVIALGAAAVLSGAPLVRLTIDVEVMNTLLLPVALFFLLALESRALPAHLRLHGFGQAFAWAATLAVVALSLFTAARLFA